MSEWSKGSLLDFSQVFRKAADYCAIQDRCIYETKQKLKSWNIESNFFPKIITALIDEGFLDEKRFAINYTSGKFRINGWGQLKISAGLRSRNIPTGLIHNALSTIDTDDYTATLDTLLQKKLKQLGGNTPLNRQKAARFAASRGFETNLIATLLRDSKIVDL